MKGAERRTELYVNRTTEKDHPVIYFRGKLDKICAYIIDAQLVALEMGNDGCAGDLQEVLEFVRSLFKAEYTGKPLKAISLLGMSSEEIRERSQSPERFYGRKHLLMHHSLGRLCIRLNILRTIIREAELAGIAALRDENDPSRSKRDDIVEGMNRLSSLVYILIYKNLPDDYNMSWGS